MSRLFDLDDDGDPTDRGQAPGRPWKKPDRFHHAGDHDDGKPLDPKERAEIEVGLAALSKWMHDRSDRESLDVARRIAKLPPLTKAEHDELEAKRADIEAGYAGLGKAPPRPSFGGFETEAEMEAALARARKVEEGNG